MQSEPERANGAAPMSTEQLVLAGQRRRAAATRTTSKARLMAWLADAQTAQVPGVLALAPFPLWGDKEFVLRLKLFLFEQVEVQHQAHGHKLIHCSGPKDEQVVGRVRELLELLAD